MSKTKYHRDSNKGRLVLGLTVRLAPYAASYVDNPQQSAPSARAEQNNWRLSAVLVPSTPLFAMTADCSGLHQLPSSTARFRSLLRYRLTVSTGQTGTVADLKQPLETVLVSVATQPSLFSFFFLLLSLSSVSSDCTQSVRLRVKFGVTQTSPGVWLKREVSFLAVYILRVSV